jgi:hypothetical protein
MCIEGALVSLYTYRIYRVRLACICFEEFINQLNLLYIYICLYLHKDKSYET